MKGTRIYGDNDVFYLQPGEYAFYKERWFACSPNDLLSDLSQHEVIEHPDGTISVTPSILVFGGRRGEQTWHGYLEHGVWREV